MKIVSAEEPSALSVEIGSIDPALRAEDSSRHDAGANTVQVRPNPPQQRRGSTSPRDTCPSRSRPAPTSTPADRAPAHPGATAEVTPHPASSDLPRRTPRASGHFCRARGVGARARHRLVRTLPAVINGLVAAIEMCANPSRAARMAFESGGRAVARTAHRSIALAASRGGRQGASRAKRTEAVRRDAGAVRRGRMQELGRVRAPGPGGRARDRVPCAGRGAVRRGSGAVRATGAVHGTGCSAPGPASVRRGSGPCRGPEAARRDRCRAPRIGCVRRTGAVQGTGCARRTGAVRADSGCRAPDPRAVRRPKPSPGFRLPLRQDPRALRRISMPARQIDVGQFNSRGESCLDCSCANLEKVADAPIRSVRREIRSLVPPGRDGRAAIRDPRSRCSPIHARPSIASCPSPGWKSRSADMVQRARRDLEMAHARARRAGSRGSGGAGAAGRAARGASGADIRHDGKAAEAVIARSRRGGAAARARSSGTWGGARRGAGESPRGRARKSARRRLGSSRATRCM